MSFAAVLVGTGSLLTMGAATGVTAGVIGGAAIGAGAGQLIGGNTKSTLTGAGIGAGAGFGLASLGGAGAAPAAGSNVWGAELAGGGAMSSSFGGAGAAGGGGFLTTPLIAGQAWSNPLMLGAAGLNLASAFGSTGTSFQDKLRLSKEGKALEKKYATASKGKMKKALAGDVREEAFSDVSNLKKAEAVRQKVTEQGLLTAQAGIGNLPKESRGGAASGGKLVRAELADTSERMEGLFAPTSTLNAYRKQELMNSVNNLSNLYNIENQTASFQYSSQLAQWGANQRLATQKGAALGSVASMIGGTQLSQAYLNRIKASNMVA